MAQNEDVPENLDRFQDIIEKLAYFEVKDELVTFILLPSLPPSLENFSIAMETEDKLSNFHALKLEASGREREDRESVNDAVESNGSQQAFVARSQEKENVYKERSVGPKKEFSGKMCVACGRKEIWLIEDGDHRERVNGALVGNVTQQAFFVCSQEKEYVYWERSVRPKKKFSN